MNKDKICEKCGDAISHPLRPLEAIVLIQRENGGEEIKRKKLRLCTACAAKLIEWVEVMGHADV